MTYLFYFLARHQNEQVLVRNELLPIVQNSSRSELDLKALQDAPILNSIINETLRLWPPVLSGLSFITPPEGIAVGKTFVPGNVTVLTPAYIIQRLERCFVHADEFIPERWTSQPELILDKTGYAPFSLGRTGCLGKQLALLELRTIITLLVTRFSIAFAPGSDGSEMINETTDHFASSPGKLDVVFTLL